MTNLLACLLRRALILAVQGLMMLSEGEMYLLFLLQVLTVVVHDGDSQWGACRIDCGEGLHVRIFLGHLGLEDLAMVFHALDVLAKDLLVGHGGVGVLVGENLG